VSIAIISLLLLVVFAAAIPAANRLPGFFAAGGAVKPSEIGAVLETLLSTGRLAGVLLMIFGLAIANLATLPPTGISPAVQN
jgi:hypothetical protein